MCIFFHILAKFLFEKWMGIQFFLNYLFWQIEVQKAPFFIS